MIRGRFEGGTLLWIARAVLAAALILRLAGFGGSWLPGAGVLFLVLASLHSVAVWRAAGRASWRGALVPYAFQIGLMLVALAALVVRLPGVGADIGHAPLDIDEGRLASSVKHFFVTGQIQHLTVEHYPGLVFWLFAAASFLNYLRGITSGVELRADQVPIGSFVLAARVASVFAAAATVVVTGLIGRRLAGAGAGLVAALVVALVPLSVDTTTVVRNDAGMVLVVVAAVHAAVVFHERRRRSWLIAAGILAGLATAIKYSSVFAIVPIVIAAVSGEEPLARRLQACALALAVFVAAIAVTNHFVWWDFPNFLHQLAAQVALTASGHWAAIQNPAGFYIAILDRFGPGIILVSLAAGYAVYGLATRRIPIWIVLSFPLLYLWFMTRRPSQFPRWVYPLVPFVAIAGSAALFSLLRFVRVAAAGRPARTAVALRAAVPILLIASLAQPVWSGAVSFSRRMTAPTHARVEQWLEAHATPGSVAASDLHFLDFTQSRMAVRRLDFETMMPAGAIEQLAGCDWLVVPEPYFGNPMLRRLGFVQRFHADRSFGGSTGYDYEIYAVPKTIPGAPQQP